MVAKATGDFQQDKLSLIPCLFIGLSRDALSLCGLEANSEKHPTLKSSQRYVNLVCRFGWNTTDYSPKVEYLIFL